MSWRVRCCAEAAELGCRIERAQKMLDSDKLPSEGVAYRLLKDQVKHMIYYHNLILERVKYE